MGQDNFTDNFIKELTRDWYKLETNNVDLIRFPNASLSFWSKIKQQLKNKILKLLINKKIVYFHENDFLEIVNKIRFIFGNSNQFDKIYRSLENDSSRSLMIQLLVYRILGSDRVKLPLNNPMYWNNVNIIQHQLLQKLNSCEIQSLNGYLNSYKLDTIGFPIFLNAHQLNILCTFTLEQYRYDNGEINIQAENGDFVIDAGGCWGDTALYFAHKVGENGKVVCFEFSKSNLKVLYENLDLNPSLKKRIQVFPEAVWDKSGESLFFDEKGSGTSLVWGQTGKSSVSTKSIDDFVEEFKLEKVDFIKMDIEGSELKALKGAEKTIKMFKPKLAISVYHQDNDIIDVPSYLNELNLGYKFFLDHFTIHREETVLFALSE